MQNAPQERIPVAILSALPNFIGRAWALDRINLWLETNVMRTFVLTGPPGSGKSTLVARLVQMHDIDQNAAGDPGREATARIIAHFCQARSDSTLSPLRFVEALSQKLSHLYQPFALALSQIGDQNITINASTNVNVAQPGSQVAGVVIKSLHIGNLSAREAFDRVIRKPFEGLYAGDFKETIIILVDALDEALTYQKDENLVTLLSNITSQDADLPQQVRFLLTTRPDPRVLHMVGESSLDLVKDQPRQADDVREYARVRLSILPELQRDQLVDQVAQNANGNFLYARYVLDDLLSKVGHVDDLIHLPLPEGLEDIYRQFLKREMLIRWGERYRPVLGALAVARGEGLTGDQLAGITNCGLSVVSDILQACAQYLIGTKPDGPFRIYHQSFRDFLLSDKDYLIYPSEANEAVARFFLDEYSANWSNCQEVYALQHTPDHLIEALLTTFGRRKYGELREKLTTLLTDPGFLEIKTARLGVDSVLADLRAGVTMANSGGIAYTNELALLQVLDCESHNLRGWDPNSHPTLFAQQLYNRGVYMGLLDIANKFAVRLIYLGQPYLKLLWRTGFQSPELERSLSGHGGSVTAVAVTPDSRWIISGSEDTTLKVWDLLTGQLMHTFRGHSGSVTAVAVTPDSHWIVSGSEDTTLKVWDLKTGQEIRTFRGHREAVKTVAVAPDGQLIISGSGDATIKLWGIGFKRKKRTLWGHSTRGGGAAGVNGVAVTPDGKWILSGAGEGLLRVWDLRTGQTRYILSGHRSCVFSVALTPDGHKAISGGLGELRIWDIQTGQMEHILRGQDSTINAIVVTPDGQRVISAGSEGILKIWDLQARGDGRIFNDEEMGPSAISVTPDGLKALFASIDLEVRDLQTGKKLKVLAGPAFGPVALSVTKDSRWVISGCIDGAGTIALWDLEASSEMRIIGYHRHPVSAVAITPDGKYAISASGDIKLWDIDGNGEISNFDAAVNGFSNIAVTPDGQRIVTGSFDGAIKLWDLQTGRELNTFLRHEGGVNTVVVTEDCQWVISASSDSTIKVWGLKTGLELKTLRGHHASVTALAVTHDGQLIASVSVDRAVKIWDLGMGNEKAMALLESDLRQVAIASDGRTVLVRDTGNIVYCLLYMSEK